MSKSIWFLVGILLIIMFGLLVSNLPRKSSINYHQETVDEYWPVKSIRLHTSIYDTSMDTI